MGGYSKDDGSSFTAYYLLDEDRFGVCSRNIDLKETDENLFWQTARKYDLEQKLRSYGRSIAIQGEMYGLGIQGNHEKLDSVELAVFNVYDIDKRTYVISSERYLICEDLSIPHVPVLYTGFSLHGLDVSDILKMSEGPSINNKMREGLVFKSESMSNISFKAISNAWLMKHD